MIDVLRGHAGAAAWFASLSEVPAVTGISILELLQGCQNKKDVREVESFLKPLPTVWPSLPDCERARASFAEHRLRDGVGLLDILIAATVVGNHATLVTLNVKHYRGINGLQIETPYGR